MNLNLDEEALQEASDLYNRAQLSDTQQKIIDVLTGKLCEFLPVKQIAMKGFALQAARAWQKEHKALAEELENLTPSQRVDFMKFALNFMRDKLYFILRNKEHKDKIADAIQSTFEFYKKKFANR